MLYVRGESVQGHYNFNEYPIRGFCVVFPRSGILYFTYALNYYWILLLKLIMIIIC